MSSPDYHQGMAALPPPSHGASAMTCNTRANCQCFPLPPSRTARITPLLLLGTCSTIHHPAAAPVGLPVPWLPPTHTQAPMISSPRTHREERVAAAGAWLLRSLLRRLRHRHRSGCHHLLLQAIGGPPKCLGMLWSGALPVHQRPGAEWDGTAAGGDVLVGKVPCCDERGAAPQHDGGEEREMRSTGGGGGAALEAVSEFIRSAWFVGRCGSW